MSKEYRPSDEHPPSIDRSRLEKSAGYWQTERTLREAALRELREQISNSHREWFKIAATGRSVYELQDFTTGVERMMARYDEELEVLLNICENEINTLMLLTAFDSKYTAELEKVRQIKKRMRMHFHFNFTEIRRNFEELTNQMPPSADWD